MPSGPPLRSIAPSRGGEHVGGGVAAPDHVSGEDSLPLRLSLARGSLGIELSRSVARSGFVLRELGAKIHGLSFPLDLSKGIKQFRNRRSILVRLTGVLDWTVLGEQFSSVLKSQTGVDWESKVHFGSCFGPPPSGNSVAVALRHGASVIAFELLLLPDSLHEEGRTPRLYLDRLRHVGETWLGLGEILNLVQEVLFRSFGVPPVRRGRVIGLPDLGRSMLREVFPSLGFRVPEVSPDILQRLVAGPRELHLVLDERQDESAATARGLEMNSLALLLAPADELLIHGRDEEARDAYLKLLDRAPRESEVLKSLARVDRKYDHRGETVLSFALDMEERETDSSERELLLAAAHQLSGRNEAQRENLGKAYDTERESWLRAAIALSLAEADGEGERWIDRAIEASPSWALARRRRLEVRLARRNLRGALSDAEVLEAQESEPYARHFLRLTIGRLFVQAEYPKEGAALLKRALRDRPDSHRAAFLLAQVLLVQGQPPAAIALLQAVVNAHAGVDSSQLAPSPDSAQAPYLDTESLAHARYLLAVSMSDAGLSKSLALEVLTSIGTHQSEGPRARLLEGRIAISLGDASARLRAHTRLVESVEARLVPVQAAFRELLSLSAYEASSGDPELGQRALALLEELAQVEDASGEAVDNSRDLASSRLVDEMKRIERILNQRKDAE